MQRSDAIVIGAGFYGLRIALMLREEFELSSVVVLERAAEPMRHASRVNQARVHNGYHYPRSILTAYRSRANLPAFIDEFSDAVVDRFDHYYAIARRLSKVNARQFELFCERIGAPLSPAGAFASAFDARTIEAVYLAAEPAFSSQALREILLARIEAIGGIELRTSSPARRIEAGDHGLRVETDDSAIEADRVIAAAYSGLNDLVAASGLPPLALQHELTEMALVDVPASFADKAVTVMDGPFFSLMPYPDRGLHTLSHVRYTPHRRWLEGGPAGVADPYATLEQAELGSGFARMRAGASQFLPELRGLVQRGSLWEVKTVLSRSEQDDSRPILYRRDHGLPGLTCILGGKLDNIYDVLSELRNDHERR